MSAKVHTRYQWIEKRPEARGLGFSHNRQVFISSENSTSSRWVAKLETQELRKQKEWDIMPLSEEVAYKICKLFGWDTMPKAKVVYECSIEEKPKYSELMRDFVIGQGVIRYPFTFTFQLFVEGETLPNKGKPKTQNPDLHSYQKAYLINSILGRYDARGDNSIYNPITSKLFEIDNDCIGFESYDKKGVLHDFADLKEKEIATDILDKVLNVTSDQLDQIRNKYKERERSLLDFWSKEICYIPEFDPKGKIDRCWMRIMNNFKFLQEGILFIRKQGGAVTIAKFEEFISNSYAALYKPKFHNSSMWRT